MPPLPAGWAEGRDPARGVVYYCSALLGVSTWERPAESAGAPPFVPAASFAGARPGYAFKTGPQGLGYYRDGGLAANGGAAGGAARPVSAVGPSAGLAASAPPMLRKSKLEQIAEQQAKRHRGPSKAEKEEVDPMDPSAYSDAPRGSWGTGLEKAQERAD